MANTTPEKPIMKLLRPVEMDIAEEERTLQDLMDEFAIQGIALPKDVGLLFTVLEGAPETKKGITSVGLYCVLFANCLAKELAVVFKAIQDQYDYAGLIKYLNLKQVTAAGWKSKAYYCYIPKANTIRMVFFSLGVRAHF
jgi:hypothetical protein